MTMGVNHLGHFYLTYLLWELIGKAEKSRIINVASLGHRGYNLYNGNLELPFDDFNYKKNYSGILAYSRSKIANILFAR